jgi:putative endonuclease
LRVHRHYVYLMASKSRVIYTGMGDLVERVWQHKFGKEASFTHRYNVNRLVYFELFRYVNNCIHREKQVKNWTRAKRVTLIESLNPTWEDLAGDWFDVAGRINRKSRSLAALGMTNFCDDEDLTGPDLPIRE